MDGRAFQGEKREIQDPSRDRGVRRRRSYVPASDQEAFIVPLLKERIAYWVPRLVADGGRDVRRVLDAGCGRQPFRELVEVVGGRYHSLDVALQEGVSVDYIGALDGDLPGEISGGSGFDVVLCLEVLEHVCHWERAFANLSRLLRPGGRVLLTCPFFYPLHEEPHDYWRPTPYAFREFAGRHGLSIEAEERLGTSWDILGTLLARQQLRAHDRGLGARLFAKGARWVRRGLFRLLAKGVFQRLLHDDGPLYLSNLVVLRKADERPERAPSAGAAE